MYEVPIYRKIHNSLRGEVHDFKLFGLKCAAATVPQIPVPMLGMTRPRCREIELHGVWCTALAECVQKYSPRRVVSSRPAYTDGPTCCELLKVTSLA